MMKRLIQMTTIFMIFPIWGFCQNKLPIGVNFNQEMNLLTFENTPAHEGVLGFGYSMGIQGHFELGEKTFLRSGINYQNNRYHSNSMARWSTGHISNVKSDITIKSIGIPIDFGYRIKSKNRKINFLFGFGGLVNLNLDYKIEVLGLGNQKTLKNEMNKSSYSIGVFGGLEKQISDRIILGLEPNFRYGSDIFISSYSKGRRIEYGITLRIRKK